MNWDYPEVCDLLLEIDRAVEQAFASERHPARRQSRRAIYKTRKRTERGMMNTVKKALPAVPL